MIKDLDYSDKLKRSRKRNKNKSIYYIALVTFIVCIFIVSVFIFAKTIFVKRTVDNITKEELSIGMENETESVTNDENDKKLEEVLSSYNNLGIVSIDGGYLNLRKEPGKDKEVIGKLYNGGAVDILDDTNEEWFYVSSGGINAYVSKSNIVLGEEAKNLAKDYIKLRAIILSDKLRVRERASDAEDSKILDIVEKDERYEVLEDENSWVKIKQGYISKDYIDLKYCLDEAKRLDLKAMVLNIYNDLGISIASGYTNIRKEAKIPENNSDSNIIGKLPNGAAADIIEILDGWYKIKSGSITGYVSSDYIVRGQEAEDIALKKAELMAVIKGDVVNARKTPEIKSDNIWTQISNSEKYPVVKQLDGWIEIELEDDNNTYVSTDFVDVRYALNEAVKFNPKSSDISSKNSSLRSKVVNYALQFLGNPYVWGGESLTRGVDCSGFTMKVLGNFGYSLPHYSISQSGMGKKIDSSQMRPGDLIFYANNRGTINHVSMYIGNGQVVHAASRRSGIKISSWNYRRPVAIRNVIGD